MKTNIRCMAAVAALLSGSQTVQASTILLPGTVRDDAYIAMDAGTLDYEVRYVTGTATVSNGLARITLAQTLHLNGTPESVVALIPLPAAAGAGKASLEDPHGKPLDGATVQILSADAASVLYQDMTGKTKNHRLARYTGTPTALIRGLAPDAVMEFTLRFEYTPAVSSGMHVLDVPLAGAEFTGKPIQRLVLNADLADKIPVRAVFSPTHNITTTRPSPFHARLSMAEDNFSPTDDLRVMYTLDEDPLGVRLLTHRQEGEAEGYFMLLGNSTGGDHDVAVPKDIVFVLDTSGSMRGEKMEQSRSAIEYCMAELNPGDRFNIIAFGTTVSQFSKTPTPITPASRREADLFLDSLVAVGRTNIGDALKLGLQGEAEDGRVRIMMFMTDGAPTAGELVPENILKQVPEWNSSKTHIYVMGVGDDVDAHLLDTLAESTEGASTYISEDEEIDVKVASLYKRLSYPVLGNVKVAFGELNPKSVYPQTFHTIFREEMFVVMGRYREGGQHTITISGELAGAPKSYEYPFSFPNNAQPEHDYVATLWASRKIGFLLKELRLHGESEELITEVVALSKEYGIATEYTAFIAAAGGTVDDQAAAERVREVSASAHRQKGGKWAVSQADNDNYLQGKMNAAVDANTFRDRSGEVQKLDNLKQVGRTCYYRNDAGQWVQQGQEKKDVSKTRVIARDSQEYYELVRKDKNFARAQALGQEVLVEVDKETVLVK